MTKDTLHLYAGHHRRLFFVFGPLGHTPALDSEAAALEAELAADGYRLVDSIEAQGRAGSISVSLCQANQ